MLLRQVIGRVLRRLRQDQGRTLQDVAQAAGLSTAYLSELERGRKEPSSEMLASICRALGVALDELLLQAMQELTRNRPMAAAGWGRPVRRAAGRRLPAGRRPGRAAPFAGRPTGRPTGRPVGRVVAGPPPCRKRRAGHHHDLRSRPPR
ncbi:helix-turn-helix domain-containing protein [Micromonospora sp. LOL_023]|uniref:helix-turn-helix domain-containing protein n=1 Tax=Micromonospora sp. LOL_023 TaxID=3345418 RepID=UPI003A8C291E